MSIPGMKFPVAAMGSVTFTRCPVCPCLDFWSVITRLIIGDIRSPGETQPTQHMMGQNKSDPSQSRDTGQVQQAVTTVMT